MMKFKVIGCHPWTGGCDMKPKCPFCYVTKKPNKNTKPNKFWYDLIPYMKKLAPQVALGANGEPFKNINFVREFSRRCKQHKLICNCTTNGHILMKLTDKQLKDALKNITMVSISWDKHKIKTRQDELDYWCLVSRIKENTNCQVGCNLLIDNEMDIIKVVETMFRNCRVNRVFALYPKNLPRVNILKKAFHYYYLTNKYRHFYVDETIRMVIKEKGYNNWKHPCHFAKDMISVNQLGEINGCSFDDKVLLKINKPKDILKIKDVKTEGKYSCPYIK